MTKKEESKNIANGKILPPDNEQRELILTELDKNLLVEASAGTGKTTSLLGRMISLLAEGKCQHISKMAAVTFTKKAAAELRSRFQVELEQASRDAEGVRKRNLTNALENIEQCFIGTIHSFCGRMLRERPVEADIDPSFVEIEDDEDTRLRKEVWRNFCARIYADDPNNILEKLNYYRLRLEQLEHSFLKFADYPDVERWPLPDDEFKPQEITVTKRKLIEYVKHINSLLLRLPKESGNDGLIPHYKQIPRIISHYNNLEDPSELMEVLELINKNCKVVQKEWIKTDYLTREDAKDEQKRWRDFREFVIEPSIGKWRRIRYRFIIGILQEALKEYDELRKLRGVVNFQDLLMKTASLLRDKPNIRRYFRNRFTHLLVDEFQDTDPIQAEIMFLLTSENPEETDWLKCKPSPGSLFVVGDPKQSIYRFRRADIITYNQAKDIIENDENGMIVKLSANFRSTGSVIDWINGVFQPKSSEVDIEQISFMTFGNEDSPESPAYVPLEKGGIEKEEGDLFGVYKLTIAALSKNKREIVEREADRIARIIRYVLDEKTTIPNMKARGERKDTEGFVSPSDFIIITKTKKHLNIYAEKLQEYGIPHRVTGGSALNEIGELRLLYLCLNATINPEDPVALVALLRSEFFGISDRSLYRFKKYGGKFNFFSKVPKELPKDDRIFFETAYQHLRKYSRWLEDIPPISAIEKIAVDSGLLSSTANRPGGEMEAGGLSKAIEILRTAQFGMWTKGQIIDYLKSLIDREEKYDGTSARSMEVPSVSIMNLHKAKGLEAPIVFLADPYGANNFEPDFHIDRTGNKSKGYIAVSRKIGEYNRKLLACPANWEEILSKREQRFLDAELLRLRYVAATRACSVLIVSLTAGGKKRFNFWESFAEKLSQAPEIFDPSIEPLSEEKGFSLDMKLAKEFLRELPQRIQKICEPTYGVLAVKDYALQQYQRENSERDRSSEKLDFQAVRTVEDDAYGLRWGSVIHSILQTILQSDIEDLVATAKSALREKDVDIGLAETAVETIKSIIKSDFWQRAINSQYRLTEVPFQLLLDKKDKMEKPVVLRGVIDLVFKENDGWVLIDYKTDLVGKDNLEDLVRRYTPQVRIYADAWKRCTGESIKSIGLYFTRINRLVEIK